MSETTNHEQEHDVERGCLLVSGYVGIAILFLVGLVVILRVVGAARYQAERNARWDQKISEIKQGSQHELYTSSFEISDPDFSKKLMQDPECLEKIKGIFISSFYPHSVPDENARFLQHLTNLKKVDIIEEGHADVFLKQLQGNKCLENICVARTPFSREGAQYIATLPNLKELDFNQCNFDDEGLAALRGHPTLETLRLINTQVSDEGLAMLSEIPKLRSVWVQFGGLISQEGIDHLKKLTNIKELHLGGYDSDVIQIDSKKLSGLKEALPNCEIEAVEYEYD